MLRVQETQSRLGRTVSEPMRSSQSKLAKLPGRIKIASLHSSSLSRRKKESVGDSCSSQPTKPSPETTTQKNNIPILEVVMQAERSQKSHNLLSLHRHLERNEDIEPWGYAPASCCASSNGVTSSPYATASGCRYQGYKSSVVRGRNRGSEIASPRLHLAIHYCAVQCVWREWMSNNSWDIGVGVDACQKQLDGTE